jgi:phosphoribosylamine--glycine ligase
MPMNILILGGGGREHALAWAIQQNPKCDRLIAAPGNAGIEELCECADLNINDGATVVTFAAENAVDFVVIGPEAPLAAGVADDLRAAGILCFGPSAAAAQLETSKTFTKEICDAANAPTAAWARFTDAAPAKAYIASQGAPIVIKADGLAAGKGVVVAMTEAEANAAIDDMLGGKFGAAGASVVIEEFMDGEEASFFILCNDQAICPIGTAQDHKRVGEGDTGPNTGGMGAYSPAPVLTQAIQTQVLDEIIRPTLAQMSARGTPFQGVLYAGLMIKDGRARLVEYNVRFGDPECQALMIRLGAQVLDALLATAEGRLDDFQLNWADDHAMTVVLASQGYPGDYAKDTVITGAEYAATTANEVLFHAGTARNGEGALIATGGRVLNATARGDSLAQARNSAYAVAGRVTWPEGFMRRDIGHRILE